jgi:hypothetical protein
MGQLKPGTFSRLGTAKVCPAGVSALVNSAESFDLQGERLCQRLSRLDSELERSRAELGVRDEVEHIEISRPAVFGPIPESRGLLNAAQIEVATQEEFSIDRGHLSKIISFFKLLDRWDREAKSDAKSM